VAQAEINCHVESQEGKAAFLGTHCFSILTFIGFQLKVIEDD
jgi:hypothetical protein